MTASLRPFPSLIAVLVVLAGCGNAAFGASVSRSRVYHSDKAITNILVLLGVGTLFTRAGDDLIAKVKKIEAESPFNLNELDLDLASIHLLVDGKEDGLLEDRMPLAAARIARYINDKDHAVHRGDQTSVELRYEFRYRHLRVCRSTYVAEGHLRFETKIYGKIKQADFLLLTADGQESGKGPTRIVLSCRAHAPIGRCPCGPITRIAERVMAKQVDEKLWDLERHARVVVDAGGGAVSDLVDGVLKELIEETN